LQPFERVPGTSTRHSDSTIINQLDPDVNSSRKRLRKIIYAVGAVFAVIVLIDALDLFVDKNWGEIPHGNHSHFVSYDKDEGVSVSNCPQRPPAADEMISRQCQMLKMVKVDNVTHYVPTDRNPNVPTERFPTRPPGSGVIITPNGELASGDDH
jgi:hypothetical protein